MKQRLREQRFDNTGGLNTKVSPDLLNVNEFVELANARLTHRRGAISPRLGSRRMHTTAFGDAVLGVTQWIPEGEARQLVAVADGDLHYKTTTYGAFTDAGGSVAGGVTQFATMRQSTSGAPLRLYVADGTKLWRWDGAALTQISGSNSIPDNVDLVVSIHARLFMRSTDYKNSLFWTDIGNPEAADGVGKDGGGSAIVDVLGGEYISALQVVGGAVLIGTQDTVASFEGYSDDDIQIAQDTEGVSVTKGPAGPLCFGRYDKLGFMFSSGGLHYATVQEAPLISQNVEPDLLALDRTYLANACVGINEARREVWFAAAGASDSGLNKTIFIYSIDLQKVVGVFTYSFGITCFASVEDANGDPILVAGCADGYVRQMDTGFLDDVLADGTGGSAFTITVEYSPITFPEAGPEVTKTLHRFSLQADLGDGSVISIKHAFDGGTLLSDTLTGALADRVLPYRVDATAEQGERLRVQLVASSSTAPEEWSVAGLSVYAFDMLREIGAG